MKYIVCMLLLMLLACKKLITVDTPASELPASEVFNDATMADAAVADIYYVLSGYYTSSMLTVINGMTADELITLNPPYTGYVNNAILANDALLLSAWRDFYKAIYRANAALEGLATATNIPSDKLAQLTGEARFLRAFSYYYLVSNWGDVPLITTTDVTQTASAARTPVSDVYKQILSDLQIAEGSLPEAYSSSERVRANKWAATAMLARVSLQLGNWQDAEADASVLINTGLYLPLSSPDSIFLKNSRTAILQIWIKDGFTFQGQTFLPSAGSFSYFPLTTDLMNAFEPGDTRKDKWTATFTYGSNLYYYPRKYKNRLTTTGNDAEYLMVLRIAEQYFIRAEARCQQNNMSGAIADINVIRRNAGLADIAADMDKETCLLTIEKERRAEMFTEWGDRWLNLKRTGRINTVLDAQKSGWTSEHALYPIPQQERNRNPNLTQNEGY
jgi:starch-binding outer membrane protein, SusD/RagB family